MSSPIFSIPRTWRFPQAIGQQHFGADDFKAEASSFPCQQLHQPVQALGISGGVAVGEVVENGLSVVLNCQSERQECIVDIKRVLLKPCKIALQGDFFGFCFINLVKRFFEEIGHFQAGKVLEPCLNYQLFALVQVVSTAQEQVLVVHQSPSLFVGQAFSHLFTDMLQTSREQFEDMELVYHQVSVWQHLAHSLMVTRPHIGANNGDLFLHFGRQILQVVDDAGLLAVSQQVNNMMAVNVGKNATVLVQQVQLVNAQIKQLGFWKTRLNGIREFAEQNANQLFINAHFISNAGKGSAQGLRANVVDQALCHEMVFMHVRQGFKKGLATFAATIAFALNHDSHALVSDGNIQIQLGLDLMPVELVVSTVGTTRRRREALRLNVKVVFILVYHKDVIVGQPQKIQRHPSMLQIVESLFFLAWINTVKEGRRLLRAHSSDSTHFSE